MIDIYEIESASSFTDLDELVEKAADELNIELDSSMTYEELADFFAEEAIKAENGQAHMEQMAEILYAANTKWHELA